MSRLERCPCLVITGLHLLPTACSSSSITAFAASPPSSRNEAGKSARDGRDDCLHANIPLEENKGVKIWREQTVVLRRRSQCQPDVSMQPWDNNLFYIRPFRNHRAPNQNHQNKSRWRRDGGELNKATQWRPTWWKRQPQPHWSEALYCSWVMYSKRRQTSKITPLICSDNHAVIAYQKTNL